MRTSTVSTLATISPATTVDVVTVTSTWVRRYNSSNKRKLEGANDGNTEQTEPLLGEGSDYNVIYPAQRESFFWRLNNSMGGYRGIRVGEARHPGPASQDLLSTLITGLLNQNTPPMGRLQTRATEPSPSWT